MITREIHVLSNIKSKCNAQIQIPDTKMTCTCVYICMNIIASQCTCCTVVMWLPAMYIYEHVSIIMIYYITPNIIQHISTYIHTYVLSPYPLIYSHHASVNVYMCTYKLCGNDVVSICIYIMMYSTMMICITYRIYISNILINMR